MIKREGKLKAAFARELRLQRPDYHVLRYATAGAPDRSIVGAGRQTNWELKHGTPDFVSHGIQELFCMRLAIQGHCRYVVWQEHKGTERTMIVHPKDVYERSSWALEPEDFCVGFDHQWLVEQVRRAHEL